MTSLHHHLSIRNQLLLLVLAVTLPAAAIFVYYAADDSRQAREAAYANLRLAADNTAARLDRILQEHEQVLERLAARPMVKALDPRHCDPIIAEYVHLHPEFTTLAVRNAQAELACSFNPKPPPPSRIVGLDWFRQGMRSGKFSVGNVYRGQSSGRWVSVLTYPIRNAQNEVSGLIAFALDLRTLDRRVFQRTPKDVVQLVLDRNAKVLLRSVDSANWIGRALPELQVEALGAKHTGIFSMRGVDGVQRLYALATVPDAGWHVLAGLPEEQAFADYHARVRRAAFAGLGTLLLVFGLAWRLARAIARPVSELAATATRIAAGDAGARARIAGPAEIRYVAQEFNCMLDAQERQREERAALIGEFERLVRLARDIFLLLDPAGNIVEANAAAAAAYGYGADELRRMNVRELRAPQARSTLAQDWEKSLQPGGVLFESVHQRKDGTTFPVEISSQTIDLGGKPYRQSFIRDISARHAAAEQIKRLNTAYAMLSETNQSIVRLGDEAELLQHICRVAVDFGGYAGAWVALIDAPSRRLVPAAIEGSIGEYVRRITISTDPERPEGRGPMALALREGRPYYCRDFFDDPATEPWQALAAKAGIRALAALPLRRGGKVIGTFNLYSAEPAVYDDATRALLEEMALDISFALDNFDRETARREAEVEIGRYVARLEQAMQSTLQAVSLMVELRDPYTAGHERRVGELAAAIGIEMDLSEATVKGLRLAGYVHDIGKVSIPAEILSKPSRLTAMEFELIKGHCRSGYDVLKGVDFPWPVADVILQHHERLDGSGYPRALKDGEILLETRIIAVADVVEAMSSHRPYRAGLGSEAALAEIETKAGILYDSAVAAACLRLFRERAYRLDT